MKILILGATSDIGIAVAKLYASKRANIILASRNSRRSIPLAKNLEIRYEIAVDLMEFDGINYQSHDDFVQQLPDDIDIALCVFGYLGDQEESMKNWKEAEKILTTNYLGAISILDQLAIYFSGKGNGSIIGISSVAGDRGRGSNYHYGSAKAGLTAYLSGLRNSLYTKGVNVITIKPGFVATKMTDHLDLPKPLTNTPEEIAQLIYKAQVNKKAVAYPFPWRLIMFIIGLIPESIFKKLNL
ncbi:MAG: SDR family oxidoreductase [Cyclobacteriaceae bacterium]|nr:SDR family oxidoreductase [Cyclobacteriaceae bacterium SS2]